MSCYSREAYIVRICEFTLAQCATMLSVLVVRLKMRRDTYGPKCLLFGAAVGGNVTWNFLRTYCNSLIYVVASYMGGIYLQTMRKYLANFRLSNE